MKRRLTYQYAKKHNYTVQDCVDYYFPKLTESEKNKMLFESTMFPKVTEWKLFLRQLYNLYVLRSNLEVQGGGNNIPTENGQT